jgi:hypothetical protein
MVVPAGMPAPVMVCPLVTPVRLNTEVMLELPAVTMPKNVEELVVVAAFDITMVLMPLVEAMVVPVGMPVPEMAWPANTPVRLDTPVMDVLPEATKPVSAALLFAVAAFDITMVALGALPLVEATVVPDAMPVPEMGWPACTPLRFATPVIFKLPEVTMPATVLELLAVAFADSVIVLLLMVRASAATLLAVAAFDITMVALGAVPLVETTVVADGMPAPVMIRPVETPLRLDTDVIFKLPEVTMPVGVTLLEVNDAMVEPAAMPVPVMGCPDMNPVVLDTVEMVLLPEVTRPVIKLGLVPKTVVPVGMPVPEMGCPVTIPVVPLAFAPESVTTGLPEVRLPVREATKLDVVAFALIVIVLPVDVALTAVMVVGVGVVGMPGPVITCPRTTELMLDTVLRIGLPETVTPEAVAVLFAVAGALIVTVVTPTFVMTVLAVIPVPVRG